MNHQDAKNAKRKRIEYSITDDIFPLKPLGEPGVLVAHLLNSLISAIWYNFEV